MAKVAVFDSGLGSLSVIKAIQKTAKSEIIYFADRQSFPYGTKSKRQLRQIIQSTVRMMQKKFAPDVIVMASNTPSIMLGRTRGVIGVYPPIKAAARITRTKNIAILGTESAVSSRELDCYIKSQNLPKHTSVHKINASELVSLVEAGRFLTDRQLCKSRIACLLGSEFKSRNIDAATLSSTHLAFLKPLLESELDCAFLDPAQDVADKVAKKIKTRPQRNRLRIYTSGDAKEFEAQLAGLGIRNKVNHLAFLYP